MGIKWGRGIVAGANTASAPAHIKRILLISLLRLPIIAMGQIPPDDCADPDSQASTPSRAFMPIDDGSVVRHRPTGLEWQRCAIGQQWHDGACLGEAERLSWEAAGEVAQAKGDGWRLPLPWELQSIVEYCRVGPAINRQVFPDQPLAPANVWSGMPYAGAAGYAWSVRFSTGEGSWGLKHRGSRVRLVRDSQAERQRQSLIQTWKATAQTPPGQLLSATLQWKLPNELLTARNALERIAQVGFASACFHEDTPRRTPSSAFDISDDGKTVLHRPSSLEWQRCPLGQNWAGDNCEGEAKRVDWQSAQEIAEQQAHGWRLPTIGELVTIAETCRSGPAINQQIFPGITEGRSAFWSVTPYAGSDTYAWDADFADGSFGWTRRTIPLGIRLVRAQP
ncbi:DUF1566 domain-containing protein [Gammaproteobacteria bacterium AB-CW1]|uniref:DUF1566 domain-containing protein n=1 Tax=Natronospira elongata TaxID=3110268 RepID=A0AAP6MN10_9GAMM|nr:DUF1566 domain-containing protein [Gammaproteobacteria bacterium AB-CW1]